VIAVARGGACIGLLALGDGLRADAREAVAALRGMGLETILVTGDNERTARVIAGKLGIDAVHAGVLPGGKADIMRQLQARGRVAMVGDGINDAPALMQADVGIAIGAGTDIAIESADVVLVGQRLNAVVDAFSIGKLSYRKTVQNLSLAFAFNGIGVPLAVTGLVHPVWAMIAMAASITAVLTNSFAGRLLPAKTQREVHARITYTIANMHCEHCLASIAEAVRNLDGIDDVSGEPEKKLVTVTYRTDRADPDGIREAIIERGFEVVADKSEGESVNTSFRGEQHGMGT
jgi:cation transport ATPase